MIYYCSSPYHVDLEKYYLGGPEKGRVKVFKVDQVEIDHTVTIDPYHLTLVK